MNRPWARVDDLIATLRRRWLTGRYLQDYASGTDWTPIGLPIHAPKASELLDRFDDVRRWIERFERENRGAAGGHERFAVEYRDIKSRTVGTNRLPAKAWIHTFEDLCRVLGTATDVQALDNLLVTTHERLPALVQWVAERPLDAIAANNVWPEVLDTVEWIVSHETPDLYVRHIDVEHVDTKFVETYRDLVSELLTRVLPADRFDASVSRGDFAARFRFRRKPGYVRFRFLTPEPGWPTGLSEFTLRTDEFANVEPQVGTIYVIENEITYLAFPSAPDALVVFGSGFALSTLGFLPWLARKQIVYWGDIDTHGFAILNHLRSHFPHVRSILMDHATLHAHPRQWVEEPTPTRQLLPHLTQAEAALYRDLIEDRFGTRVRLEQERVRFSLLRQALGLEATISG